jgi:twinkle protein
MINKLRNLGIDVKLGSRGDVKVKCPKCSPDRKNKSDLSLSVNVEKGLYRCHHCDFKGGVNNFSKKEYTRPNTTELKRLSQPVIDWFAARGITNQTLLRYQVSEGSVFMPQAGENRNAIHFNYFINNELINVKFRDRDKNFKLVSGAQLCLYGLDVALDNSSDSLVICEGECDVMAFYEAGIKNAVSVPNGASKGNQKLEWLEEMLPYLEGKTIYLAVDMDEAGRNLRDELARRLGKQNCKVVVFPEKDSNDTLKSHGKEALEACILNAEYFPIDGIEVVNGADMALLWEEGYPKGYDTGWANMDDHFVWHPGMVTLITGIPGHGKTTWLKNVLMSLASRHGWSFMLYSAEEASAKMAITDLISIKTGKSFFFSPNCQRITKSEVEMETLFINDHFKYYELDENDSTIESIMAKAEEMIKRTGIRGIVIDNMSSVERGIVSSGDKRHNAIGDMMRDLRKFARKHDVHVWLVAHPKKMSKANGVYEIPTGYDVGDSSHYYNAPDNGITVYRRENTTEIHFWKVRFKFSGQLGTDSFIFNISNSIYTPTSNLNVLDKTKFKNQPTDYTRFLAAGNL